MSSLTCLYFFHLITITPFDRLCYFLVEQKMEKSEPPERKSLLNVKSLNERK